MRLLLTHGHDHDGGGGGGGHGHGHGHGGDDHGHGDHWKPFDYNLQRFYCGRVPLRVCSKRNEGSTWGLMD